MYQDIYNFICQNTHTQKNCYPLCQTYSPTVVWNSISKMWTNMHRRQVVNPRHQTPQGQSVAKPETPLQNIQIRTSIFLISALGHIYIYIYTYIYIYIYIYHDMLNSTKDFVGCDESSKIKVGGIFTKYQIMWLKSLQIMQITLNFGSHLEFWDIYGKVS